MSPQLARFITARPFGFIRAEDLPELIALERLCPLVVRCGRCRFICTAQDLSTLLEYVKAGGDHLRDVSVHPEAIRLAQQAPTPRAPAPVGQWFNEADCGGVFDGFRVTSDADPGL